MTTKWINPNCGFGPYLNMKIDKNKKETMIELAKKK